jgi:benzodiazapine receptor
MRRDLMNFPNTRTSKSMISFLGIVIFFQGMGGLMGWLTAQSVDDWYRTLVKSPFNPPDPVFGIVWTALYFLLSISFWRIWSKPKSPERTFVLGAFTFHMILNWLWTPLFFTAHALFPAFAMLLIILLTALILAWLVYSIDRAASLSFVPYIAWLCLAAHLSYFIWSNN